MEKLDLNNFYKYEIWDNVIDKIKFILYSFRIDWLIDNENSFQTFLQNFSEKNNFLPEDIKEVEFKNNKVMIYTKDWKNHNFDFSEYRDFLINQKLWDLNIKDLEQKSKVLRFAMESIFLDNNGIFDELDLEDRVDLKKIKIKLRLWKLKTIEWKSQEETLELLKEFEWKNLKELREELDPIEKNLVEYYNILWETKKSIEILEKQILHYAWIGDNYEWWARIFWLSSSEVDSMTTEIVDKKSVSELVEYIRVLNNHIYENWKISDMARAINSWIIVNLIEKTFEKIKKENSSNREILNFVQVITWRNITFEENWKIKKDSLEVSVKSDFKQTEVANKALVYLLYDRWIINKISEKQKPKLKDEIFEWKENNSISSILEESLEKFESLWLKKEEILKNTWLESLKSKEKISDLSFDEMLLLGSVYRISLDIEKNISSLKWKSAEEIAMFLQEKNRQSLTDTFEELNESLNDNFWATFFDWNWKNAVDFWLNWEEAEIFDLYWKINGRWLFELSDENFFSKNFLNLTTWAILWVWVLTAMLVLSPAVMAAWWASLMIAWAKIWVTTTIASQLLDDKWYDTVKEATFWIAVQAWIDIASSTFFTWWSWALIWKVAPKVSKSFWKTLQREVWDGNISGSTAKKLDNILLSWQETLKKWPSILHSPAKYWKPKLELSLKELEIFKQAWYTWKLSDKTIKFLWKYQAVNWLSWNISDAGIWLIDWIASSLLWQFVWHLKVNEYFYESHYNPDAWETFETAKELRKTALAQEKQIKESMSKIPELEKEYKELSEEDKNNLSILVLYILNSQK